MEILNAVQKAWGFVPNLHRVLAESPAALEAYSTLWGIAEKTSFTAQERNIAYLAIIYENECTYCMAGHTNLSRMTKVGPEVIAAIRENRTIADAKLEALRQFAGKVTRERGAVSETDVTTFKAAGYDNRAVLDLLVLAATKLISNYTNHLAQTPNDRFMKGRGMDGARQAQAGRLSRTRGPYPCDRNGDRTRAKAMSRTMPLVVTSAAGINGDG